MTTSANVRRVIVSISLIVAGCSDKMAQWREQLSDSDPDLRRAAIRAIEASPDAQAEVPALVKLLKDGDGSVRVAAALAIQKIDPQSAPYQQVLEDALRAGQGPVFLEVGQAGSAAEWAVPTLITLLTDRRAPIRALAAQTLGEIGISGDAVESSLRRGLHDENRVVRKACERALEGISPNAAVAK